MSPRKYALIGYQYGGSGNIAGCREGPRVIRSRGLVDRLKALGTVVEDLGDVSVVVEKRDEKRILSQASKQEQQVNNLAPTLLHCTELAKRTTLALNSQACPIILGGDHSLAIGSIAALSNILKDKGESLGLIWIDTHPDLNTPATSPSNNIFGMSTAILLGLVPGVFSTLQKAPPAIDPSKTVYIGLRELDPGEKDTIRQMGLHTFTMQDIDILGMAEVTKRAIAIAGENTAGFAVSFDLDVCDPHLVPGTGTPCRGGLTYREAHLLLELLYDSGNILLFELVELNPILDKEFRTADFSVSLIETVCGKSIL